MLLSLIASFYSCSFLTFWIKYDTIYFINSLREDDFLKKARIVLMVLGILGVPFTLINVNKDCNVLILTVMLILAVMLGTHEPKKIWAIVEWVIFFMYVGFAIYIIKVQSYHIIILLGVSFLCMFFLLRRLRNEGYEEEDWL